MYQTALFRKCVLVTGLSVNNPNLIFSCLILCLSYKLIGCCLSGGNKASFAKTSKIGLKICKVKMLENKSITACKTKQNKTQTNNSEDLKCLINY